MTRFVFLSFKTGLIKYYYRYLSLLFTDETIFLDAD
jgi:hypothetical protein